MKAQRHECGGRTLLGDNNGRDVGTGVMLWPIKFPYVPSLDFNWTPLYVHIQLTICTLNSNFRNILLVPKLPARNEIRVAFQAGKFLDLPKNYYRLKMGSSIEMAGYLAYTRHITAGTSAWEGC
jgi:hypothetical protein